MEARSDAMSREYNYETHNYRLVEYSVDRNAETDVRLIPSVIMRQNLILDLNNFILFLHL